MLTASVHVQEGRDMLVLTRRTGETTLIGDDIEITVLVVDGSQIRVGIDAPEDGRSYGANCSTMTMPHRS